ncbi:MAG: sugar phosphate isomerase/epimerase family protein [Vicinamibacterales bacterium]
MSDAQFGISTHLFHDALLTRDHLVHIAAHGFDCVELVATRSHFDYRSDEAIRELAEWLSDTRLNLHSVHAPVVEAMRGRTPVGWFSNASGDETRRMAALDEAKAALAIARSIPFDFLVVHLGVPATAQAGPGDNQRNAAHRSAEALVEAAADAGVRVAFELIQNPLSSADALVRLLEDDLDGLNASICLDYGHGHLTGDLADVIETLSGYLGTTHLHDNDGRRDTHLPPYAGTIDWDAAMMETQKIGYDGAYIFELAPTADPVPVLVKAARARERLEQTFVTF